MALTISELAYFTAAGLVLFATPFFVVGPIGSTEASVGLVVGSFSISTLLLRPIAGRLSDQRGRRFLLLGGACGFAVLVAAHLLVTNVALLVVLRLLLGAAEAFFFVAGVAILADLAPEGRVGEALSYNSLGLYLGIAFGPLLGEYLIGRWSFTGAWIGGTALAAVAAGLAVLVPDTGVRVGAEAAHWFSTSSVGPGLGLFAGVAAMAIFFAYAPLHAADIGISNVSTLLLVFGIVVVGLRVAFAKLPDRVSALGLSAAALASTAVGLTVVAVAETRLGLILGAVLLGAGMAFLTPAIFAAIFTVVPPTERGAASATASVFIDLGLGGGPLLGGLIVAITALTGSFFAAAALALAGCFFVLLLNKRRPRMQLTL